MNPRALIYILPAAGLITLLQFHGYPYLSEKSLEYPYIPLALWFFSSSLMCSLTHKAFCFFCAYVQTYMPLWMIGDCRKMTAWSVLFGRCSCPSVGTGSFRLCCPACDLHGAVEPVWIASQGLFLQLTPNKDFSNKVLIVMWCLSFEAAMVYAGLNRYHFIRNWKLWTQCFFYVS